MWETKIFGQACRIVEKSDRAIASIYSIAGQRRVIPMTVESTLQQVRDLAGKSGNWSELLDAAHVGVLTEAGLIRRGRDGKLTPNEASLTGVAEPIASPVSVGGAVRGSGHGPAGNENGFVRGAR